MYIAHGIGGPNRYHGHRLPRTFDTADELEYAIELASGMVSHGGWSIAVVFKVEVNPDENCDPEKDWKQVGDCLHVARK